MDVVHCMTSDSAEQLAHGAAYSLKDGSDPSRCCNMCLQSDFVYAVLVNSSQCLCFDELMGQHSVSQTSSTSCTCTSCNIPINSESTCSAPEPLISCTDTSIPVFRTGILSEFYFNRCSCVGAVKTNSLFPQKKLKTWLHLKRKPSD